MLPRILEPEVMDTAEDAREYDSMDHSTVNAVFVDDLLLALSDWSLQRPVETAHSNITILDLGAGTAQIPVELARRAPGVYITAVDAAESMLAVARKNIAATNLADRISLALADAKQLPFEAGAYDAVISNSIVHHIPHPREVLTEAVRVTRSGGLLFHRDLARPSDAGQLQHLVDTYAGDATPYQRRLFAESLQAALTADEMSDVAASLGFARETVRMTSDRHWTWIATKETYETARDASTPRKQDDSRLS
jgi:ubiquinone/menaquinone biosynthesis C-methylase UbiE